MQSAINLIRRYLERFPQRPSRWHIWILRLIFLGLMIAAGVLAGFVVALFVFGFTRGTDSNGIPALISFCVVVAAFSLYGVYVSLVLMSDQNLRLPD